ncbi:hypothetical protein ACR6C2_40210 [Streptomyces sp. INA 01156]
MKRWRIADEKHGQAPRCPSCTPTRTLAPMRFVQICQAGHLGDVDWWFWAHSRRDGGERRRCEERERLRFLVSERASGLEALSVACTAKGCGATRDLLDILGTHGMRCSGRNPWQRASEAVACPRPVQIVQRTAGNLTTPSCTRRWTSPRPMSPCTPTTRTRPRSVNIICGSCSAGTPPRRAPPPSGR